MMRRSPLAMGVPFFFFMAAGTYALSLFVQTRYDFVVRSSSTLATAFREERSELTIDRRIAVQDQHKKVVSENCRDVSDTDRLQAELQVRVVFCSLTKCAFARQHARTPALAEPLERWCPVRHLVRNVQVMQKQLGDTKDYEMVVVPTRR
jgi:Cytochrome c oxidase assembly protein COX16